MAEGLNSMIDQLRKGMAIICPNCGKGKIIPYNTTCDKAHSFYCEEDCGFFVNYDPVLDLE